ncbi:ethanolamine ammonia-lyase subunit EutB [Methylomonas albis]
MEDHFCGKLLGVPMGCDICYTIMPRLIRTTWTRFRRC